MFGRYIRKLHVAVFSYRIDLVMEVRAEKSVYGEDLEMYEFFSDMRGLVFAIFQLIVYGSISRELPVVPRQKHSNHNFAVDVRV
jgi:hypothetical protein